MPKLYPFQQEGVTWLAPRKTGAVFDEMGLGKSPQFLMALPPGAPVVVAVWPSSMKWKWAAEVRKWRKDYAVRIVQGSRGFRWPPPGVITIVNYEALPPSERELARLRSKAVRLAANKATIEKSKKLSRLIARYESIRAKLTAPHAGTVLGGDEAQRIKNKDTRAALRWQEMAALVFHRKGRIWLLTGTPLENDEDELWTVLQAAGLGTAAFGDHNSYKAAWQVPGKVAEGLRKVSIRREWEGVTDQLPHYTYTTRPVPVGKGLKGELDALVKTLRKRGINLATATLDQIRVASESVELKQHVMRAREALAVAKVPAMLEAVAECEENKVPLVVFSWHTRPVLLLGRRKGWAAIHGGVAEEERHRIVTAFQAGKLRGLACTYQTLGAGFDLFHANRMLHVDKPWTPTKLDQARRRIDRIGQKSKKLVYESIVADHVLEKRVDILLEGKQGKIDQSVGASAVTPGGGA